MKEKGKEKTMKKVLLVILLLFTILLLGCSDHTFGIWESIPSIEDAPYMLIIGNHHDPNGYYVKSYTIEDGVITVWAIQTDGNCSQIIFGQDQWFKVIERK